MCRVVTLGNLEMMKSIADTMFTSAMGFAWTLIRAGESTVAFGESWGANDQHAGFAELSMWKAGRAIAGAGEGLELAVNRFALWAGYDDGEVSSMVAWPALAH
jgi:hypothetical protein